MKNTPASVDIYDFDHTIYRGDCSIDFYLFCVREKPLLLRYLPFQAWHAVRFKLGLEDRTIFKGNFFVFLRGLEKTESYVARFWENRLKNIKDWYARKDHSRDVIISASSEFLLRPVFDHLQAHTLIATRMNPNTGKITGKNCRGEEKVVRFKEIFGNTPVNKAYGDSAADKPILSLAKEQYLVKGNEIRSLE